MNYHLRLGLFFFLIVVGVGCERKASPKVDFGAALKISPQFNQANKILFVKVELADGYHAYAPGEKVGQPISLSIDPKNGWRQVGQTIVPPGTTKTLGSLGKSQVLFGTFYLKTGVDNGQGPISGSIHIQICTEELCDRPKTHLFTVELAGANEK